MTAAAVQTTSEQIDKDRVRLRVEVPEAALQGAITAAYRRWAQEMKVPGFRKGKVPRQLIDARVGPEVVREEALRDALPGLYREAMEAESLEAIAPPEIEVVEFEAGTPLIFEATVDVRPEIALPDPINIEVEAPPSEVTDEDLEEQLERLQDRFAELEPIGRAARPGDFVLIDIKGYRHDELVEGASAPDLLYEVGSRSGPPSLDEELEGNKPGAILKFTDTIHIHREDEPADDHSHSEDISFTVLLKEVKAKKLLPLDDEFAKTAGEFDTLDELKDDLRTRLAEVKKGMVEDEIRARVLNAYVEASDLAAPEKLVEAEFEHRLQHFEDDLRRAGLNMDEYGRQVGLTELEIRRDMREQAVRSIKAELLLEEIARKQDVEVTQEDLSREIAMAALRAGKDPKEVVDQLVEQGRLGAVGADIIRRKALDYLVQTVNVQGRPPDEA